MYGADRYQSAGISNAKAFGASGLASHAVVLADGLPGHQGDALVASGYAGVNGYGILLTDNTNTVPANTMTALKSLNITTIQPVGGTAAISVAQLAQLAAAGYTVMPSSAGPTSLGTMEAINDTIPPSSVGTSGAGTAGTGSVKTALLASADENHLIDALSAAGLSYANKKLQSPPARVGEDLFEQRSRTQRRDPPPLVLIDVGQPYMGQLVA
ncbi:MAG: cell wall-binding repeat-containing protein [Acidimicrobiales bacterium]